MAKAVADVSGQDTAGWAYDFTNVGLRTALNDEPLIRLAKGHRFLSPT